MNIWENMLQIYIIIWLTIYAHAARRAYQQNSAFWQGFLDPFYLRR